MLCLYHTLHTALGLTVVTVTISLGRQSTGEAGKDLGHKWTCINTGKESEKSSSIVIALRKGPGKTLVGKQHQMGLHRASSHGQKPGWWPIKQRYGNIIMISMRKGIAEFHVRPIHRFVNNIEQRISNLVDDTKCSPLSAQQWRQGRVKTLILCLWPNTSSPATVMVTASTLWWSLPL